MTTNQGWRERRMAAAGTSIEIITKLASGAKRIFDERQRQIGAEGWSLEHDLMEHAAGQLAWAGLCYARAAELQLQGGDPPVRAPDDWPFRDGFWKLSTDPVRNLEKAGALLAAEIDRRLLETERSESAEIERRIAAVKRGEAGEQKIREGWDHS